jgi:energy-coupling factor transporter transmembrane protein EcfT
MKPSHRSIPWTKVALLLALVVCLTLPAWGQGCALCYTQASSAGARMVQALRSGILVLIFPPMAICIGLTVMSYKKRNRFNQENDDAPKSDLGW